MFVARGSRFSMLQTPVRHKPAVFAVRAACGAIANSLVFFLHIYNGKFIGRLSGRGGLGGLMGAPLVPGGLNFGPGKLMHLIKNPLNIA